MEYSERGIPILTHEEKVNALRSCIEQNAPEDAMGHIQDLIFADRVACISVVDAAREVIERYAKDLMHIAQYQYWFTLNEGELSREFIRFGKPTPVLLNVQH